MRLLVEGLQTPIGPIAFASGPRGLVALELDSTPGSLKKRLRALEPEASLEEGSGSAAYQALQRYFSGELEALDGLEVAPRGSAFQQRVWSALRGIPPGATATYGQIAKRLGVPRGSRAVGGANGKNPIALVIPCHRVVAQGGLGGYSSGLSKKRWLLAHEQALYAGAASSSSKGSSTPGAGRRSSR